MKELLLKKRVSLLELIVGVAMLVAWLGTPSSTILGSVVLLSTAFILGVAFGASNSQIEPPPCETCVRAKPE